tara:strand:+ start:589 stop:762 length:174 start_codon:yes stop_codon:yes gene_type:complete
MAKKKSPLQNIKKQLGKLEKLHEKEEAIIEKINGIIEVVEEGDENEDYDFDKWEGTD